MFILKWKSLLMALVFVFLATPKASAVTIEKLLVQIQALQAQLVQLQAVQGNVAAITTAAACAITESLYLGVSDPQVKCLQQYLNSAGYTVSVSGTGSPGKESAYFGAKTKAAVAKWQAANGVSPVAGHFGAISRAKYLALKSAATGAVTTPTPVPAPTTTVAMTIAPLSITTTSIPSATAGAAYSTTISAVGGNGSYSWQVSNGTFPPGLSLVQASCASLPCDAAANIFGTPVESWTYTFTIMVTSGTQNASQQFILDIYPSVTALKISPAMPASLNMGQNFETQALYTPAPVCSSYSPCAAPDTTAIKATWTSSDSNIVSISYKVYDPTTAVIAGNSPGIATITATYSVGSINISTSAQIYIIGTVPASLQITPKGSSVAVGNTVLLQTTYTPQYTCAVASCSPPSASTFQAIWISGNPGVASIVYKSDDPKTAIVTGISAGVSTITATVSYSPTTGATLTASTGLLVTPPAAQ